MQISTSISNFQMSWKLEPNSREDGAEISRLEENVPSKGVKVTLIKSSLSSLPTYFLSLPFLFQCRWPIILRINKEIFFGEALVMNLSHI